MSSDHQMHEHFFLSFKHFVSQTGFILSQNPLFDGVAKLLKDIDYVVQKNVSDEIVVNNIQNCLNQLWQETKAGENKYKCQIKELKDYHDTGFADLFMEKNDEITKLKLTVEKMKKLSIKSFEAKQSNELLAAKQEVSRLKEMLAHQNNTVNELTKELIEVRANVELLEKEKCTEEPLDVDDGDIRKHIQIIKKSLMCNRNLLNLIESKQVLYKNPK